MFDYNTHFHMINQHGVNNKYTNRVTSDNTPHMQSSLPFCLPFLFTLAEGDGHIIHTAASRHYDAPGMVEMYLLFLWPL